MKHTVRAAVTRCKTDRTTEYGWAYSHERYARVPVLRAGATTMRRRSVVNPVECW